MLKEQCHLSNDIDSNDVVFLLTKVVLDEAILPVTHETEDFQCQLDMMSVVEHEQLAGLVIKINTLQNDR